MELLTQTTATVFPEPSHSLSNRTSADLWNDSFVGVSCTFRLVLGRHYVGALSLFSPTLSLTPPPLRARIIQLAALIQICLKLPSSKKSIIFV